VVAEPPHAIEANLLRAGEADYRVHEAVTADRVALRSLRRRGA